MTEGLRPLVRGGSRRLALAAAMVICLGSPAGAEGLTAPAVVAALYDRILDADFAEVADELETCAGAPREACTVLEATRVWWRILLDPQAVALDATFQRAVDLAIARTEAWTQREPGRAEAWFYLGAALGVRVQWRVLRGQQLAAARDGKRIKTTLERALALDATLEDANFGIGLYQYYADVAPLTARILRLLLLLPGGDRQQGLLRMWRTRERGQVLRSEADYQLHLIDLWYEKNPPRALSLLEGLAARHPHNPLFWQLIAEVHDVYFHDLTASLETWQDLLARARGGRVNERAIAEVSARLGAAAKLDALAESDAAVELLRPVVEAHPASPLGATARGWLQLGQALGRMGARAEALAALQSAMAMAAPGDPDGIRARARQAQRQLPNERAGQAYRRSLDGWRAFQHGDRNAAAVALRESLAQHDDPVARYRYGHVLAAGGEASGALREFEQVLASPPERWPTFYARACVEAAALLERRGEVARALELLDRAAGLFGAARATRQEAAREAARLRRNSGGRR